jgi:ABC-2 type transport system permease protein
LCLSVTIKKIKAVMPITLSIVFLFFIIDLINQSLLEKNLTYFTPFSYFKGADLIAQKHYDLTYVVLDIGVLLVFSGICYMVYEKKDMPSI